VSKADAPYPEDEFDVPNPDVARGVHRAPRSAWSRWWPFLAVLVIAPVIAYGLVYLAARTGDLPTADSSGGTDETTTSPSVTPTTPADDGSDAAADPPAPVAVLETPIVVLNAAQISGLAGEQASKLEAAGFTAVTPENFTGTAPDDSVVYYATEDQVATAQLVATTLGITTVTLSAADAGTGISVILASDPSA
jgi:LytR cell envelope-related transcriptional attenuator